MHTLKMTLTHVANAPVACILSGMAILFTAMPSFGNAFEFHFSEFQFHKGTTEPWMLSWPPSWIGNLQSGLRILGCNWLHWSVDHLCWDLFMFYLIGSICEHRNRLAFLAVTLVSGLAIPVTVMFLSPELGSYRGLSGIDTALFALLGTNWLWDAVRDRDMAAILVSSGLLAAMVLKIAYELTSQKLLFVTDGTFTPAPTAHSIGALIGGVIAIVVASKALPCRIASNPIPA